MNVTAAVISLVAVTVVTSFCADYRRSRTSHLCDILADDLGGYVQLLELSTNSLKITAFPKVRLLRLLSCICLI